MKIIGVDVGGTKISAGLIEGGKLVKQYSCPTPFDAEKQVVVDAISRTIEKVFHPEIAGIGIGVPGLVDHERNLVIDVTNIPSWTEVPLKELLQQHFDKPVFVNNDANCFAVGEKHFGKGKSFNNFVGLAIGTGLGAGIIINGHLYSGKYSGAGEFGNLYYLDNNTEAYCSGQFFKDKGLSGAEVAQKAQAGDAESLALFTEFGHHLGKAICNILFALAPEAIILGGSVARSYHLFREGMGSALRDFPFKRLSENLIIDVSDVQNTAILGASSLVLDANR
ncbi:MAG: ROK family protein [Prolixibacteraceae bacterium]|jgi:glucokinase|nr:ROK family protein [Prolixibacteraceae bacterium]